jgi:glycosyltransferase involved in cell wall biosynthesis
MKIEAYKPEGVKRPKLSILIPSIIERAESLEKLTNKLKEQIDESLAVEIISAVDNREMNIGAKRNLLLNEATGTYVVMIDDDDDISHDYVSRIVDAIITDKPDCIGFFINCTNYPTAGEEKLAIMSLECGDWSELPEIINRTPYHLTPIKRTLAIKSQYPDIRYGEDYAYSVDVRKHLKTETFIDSVLYIYNAPLHTKDRYTK